MATYATGVAATWDGLTFGEVTELRVTHGGSLPLARGSTWTLDLGTIEISCLSTANISTAKYGKRADVSITGGGLAYSGKAVLEKFTLQGVANDVARYGVTLRIQP
jgi:hypothetical protein